MPALLLLLVLPLTLIAACSSPRPREDAGATIGDASTGAVVPEAPASMPAPPGSTLGQPCDADAGWNPCTWETEVCAGGRCVACPAGTISHSTNVCERTCTFDRDCRSGEICGWMSGAYHVCTLRPAPVKCPKGEVPIKTGMCVIPCDGQKACDRLDAGLCCENDSNALRTICRACGTGM